MTGRKPPGPVGRWFARAPIGLYRVGLGWMMGRRFAMIEHVGRVSGLPRKTVLEVIDRDPSSLDVAAAWGPRSDWFRNIVAEPSATVSTGRRRSIPATASVLGVVAAAQVFERYATEHPRAAAALAKTLALDFSEPTEMASVVPVVRFTFDG